VLGTTNTLPAAYDCCPGDPTDTGDPFTDRFSTANGYTLTRIDPLMH